MRLRDMFFPVMGWVAASMCVSSLDAVLVDGYLDLTNGYRRDKITSVIDVFDPEDTLVGVNDQVAKDMNMYQIGLKGKWVWCDWLLRLEGDYAWGDSGENKEVFAPVAGAVSRTVDQLHKTYANDFLAGTGYLFPVCYNFSIGPTVGWSYHWQRFQVGHARTDGVANPVLKGLKYTNRWQGPWAGAELAWHYGYFSLDVGYEYHWSQWHAEWTLKGPDVVGAAYSDRRRSNHAHGQVVHVEARYNYCPWWNAGIGLKFEDWKAIHGFERPRSGGFASPTRLDRVKKATWQSCAVTFDIGYQF